MKETNRKSANVAKRRARQRKLRNRRIALTVCLMLVVMAASIGGTVAWLTAKTDPVVNTFTYGDINIDLTETKRDYKMVPGNAIDKDPKVTVEANSEACWLFVKVEKSANFDAFMTYTMAEGWTALDEDKYPGVYYCQVPATTAATSFSVLAGDQVQVKEDVTKGQLNLLTTATYPTLTFTAYAVQRDNINDAATAWAKITNS